LPTYLLNKSIIKRIGFNDSIIERISINKHFIYCSYFIKRRVVWNEKARDKSEEALLNFVKRVSRYKIERLEDLLKGKATKVIVVLEKLK
jgi:hypothetical protein